MKTLIIGASGQIGKMTTAKLLAQGHEVVALVRDKSKLSDLPQQGLTIIEQDLENDFSAAFENCTQVIFAAGSGASTGADKTLLIDLWAAKRAVDFAKAHNLAHFIMVSSIGADAPDNIESSIKPYLVAKHMADEQLINSGLDYTIVRPGTLLNEPATKKYRIKRPESRQDAVLSRENVAEALVYIAGKDSKTSQVFELFDGPEPITSLID